MNGEQQAGRASSAMARHVGGREPALLGEHRKGLHAAGAVLRQSLPGLGAEEVDLAGEQVLHRGRGAAIGHDHEIGAGLLLEIEEATRWAALADPDVVAPVITPFRLAS